MSDLRCPACGSTQVNRRGFYRSNHKPRYRYMNCRRGFTEGSIPKSEMPKAQLQLEEKPCLNCGQITTNPKFCSTRCSATYTNKITPKRKAKPRFCKYCGSTVTGQRETCTTCNPNVVDWTSKHSAKFTRKRPTRSALEFAAMLVMSIRLLTCLALATAVATTSTSESATFNRSTASHPIPLSPPSTVCPTYSPFARTATGNLITAYCCWKKSPPTVLQLESLFARTIATGLHAFSVMDSSRDSAN